ncbi:DUF4142 domain-containing protein [Streptomyces sp. NPDC020298]|uniref:DUF4142 domain-containing protein n=1 Tax=Streptomyces sp. NPDC020298 TaxID=3155010 RepID=UPI0033D836CB
MGGAMAVTLVAMAYPSMLGVSTVSSDQSRIIANTQWGPLTEGDRDFVVKVRAAGLWEYPVGQIGLQKGQSPAVKTASNHLIDGHAALDVSCRKIAPLLNITLPNIASPQQEGFVTQLKSDSGKQFDIDFANILRMTHGSIFNTIAKIRSTTKNSLVRALADQANDTVLDHMTVMEKTGDVDFDTTLNTQTNPPKMPATMLTPPAPPAGQPQVVLTAPPTETSTALDLSGLGVGSAPSAPAAAPSPSASGG